MAEQSLYPYIHRRAIRKLGQDAAFIRILLQEFGLMIASNSNDKNLTYERVEYLLDLYIESKNNTIKG